MNTEQFRKIINLVEGRDPNIEYEPRGTEVVAHLKSYNSQIYTKLATKIEKIEQLESEIKQLKEEVKQETRENIAELFDATDAVHTRVVETISVIFTLSKDPKATESPKYKDILEELSTHLTPELLTMLNGLKERMVTVTQKAPSLKIRRVDESYLSNLFHEIKLAVLNWAQRYDARLNHIKQQL
jgi:Zn-dependent oligopeptidase